MSIRGRFPLAAFVAAVLLLPRQVCATEAPASEIKGGFDLNSYRLKETLRLGGEKLESPSVRYEDILAMKNAPAGSGLKPGGKRRMAIAMIASAILPGAGELYLYFESGSRPALYRAPVFMGFDAYLWYGYKTNLDKGKDFKSQYESYCDAHWSEARFLQQHPYCEGIGGCDDYHQYNDEADEMQQFYFIYMPRSQDREEFYENCGKYDAFAFGWDDWDATGWDGSYETFQPYAWTPHRTEYWSIRDESDKYLIRADQHVMFAIVNRVLSILDAAWLARGINRDEGNVGRLDLEFKPDSRMPTVGVSYGF